LRNSVAGNIYPFRSRVTSRKEIDIAQDGLIFKRVRQGGRPNAPVFRGRNRLKKGCRGARDASPRPPEIYCPVNLAVTLFALSMATVQVPEPVQAPLQLVKVEPATGVAVRVTAVP
jgi:hypothetical protein